MEQPDISVIVATCNHAAVLPLFFQHLENQEYPAGRFEVLVADAGSSDGTQRLIERYAAGSPVRVVVVPAGGMRRLVGALNAAAQTARGRVLLFLAPGLLAGPTLLERHVNHHKPGTEAMAVLGAMQTHPQVALPSFTTWFYRYAYGGMHLENPEFLDWQSYNMSLPRKVFLAANGFDETFVYPSYHAAELGWRLTRGGVSTRYEPMAHAYRWQAVSFDEALFLRYVQGHCLEHLTARTHDIAIMQRFSLRSKPFRGVFDSALMPLYLRICRGGASDTRVLGIVLRRTLRHYFLQGFSDAKAGRAPLPPVSVASYPAV